uniref:Mannose-specific lectin n=1 Tax=Anthurium amnicola TaxID=1678845 RepID=A0A1D1XRN6_9ARAE
MAAAPRGAQACFLLLLQAILLGLPSLQPCTAENVMYATKENQDFLYAGQSLAYGSYNFVMQKGCNLVLYDGGEAIWHTNTANGGTGCRATLTYDGVLVVSNESGNKLWSSEREERVDNYVLVLQRDRNVVIYGKPLWATDTKLGATLNKGKSANVTSEVAEEATGLGRKMIHMVVNNLE